MTIYLDVLIIKELVINYLIIYITEKITATRGANKFLAAFIATAYTICCFIEPRLLAPIYKTLCSMIVICISLKAESINDLIKKSIMFYFVTFFVAGIVAYKADMKSQLMYLISGVVILLKFIKAYKEKHMLKNYFCFVQIPNLDINLKALIDTGHFLKGNLNEEVIVVSPEIYPKFRGRGKETLIKYKTIDKEVPRYERNKYKKCKC